MKGKPGEQRPIIYTIGHSTKTAEEFISAINDKEIKKVADVRTIPKSRHNPQFNQDALRESLQSAQIEYLHMKGLGGLRHARRDSPNKGWKNASFRGFADYMQTAEFAENLEKLMELAAKETTVIMCAEALPWRCHRSLIADAMLVRGFQVQHIMSTGAGREHALTPWAKVEGKSITYPLTAAVP